MTPLQRARGSAVAIFAMNGIIAFSFVPRLLEIQADLGLDDASLGLVLAVGTVGGLVVGPVAGVLVHRWGAIPVAVVAGLVMAPALAMIGFAGTAVVLAAALFVLMGGDAVMDSAMNSRGLEVESAYGRSIINSFHGWWSLATIIGSGLGSLSAVLGVPLPVFLTVMSVATAVVLLLVLGAGSGVVPEVAHARNANTEHLNRRKTLAVMLRGGGAILAVFIVAAIIVEDVPVRWGSIYLGEITSGTTAASNVDIWIAVTYFALTASMTIGRFLGDRVFDLVGPAVVVRVSMAVVAVAMTGAIVVATPAAFVVACSLSGLGVATLFPAAMRAAARLPGVTPAMGVALVSWFSRVGFVLSPLLVGLIAGRNDVRAGLAVVVVAAVVLVIVASVVGRREHVPR